MYDVLHMCMDRNKNKFSIHSIFHILVRQMVEERYAKYTK